MMDWWNQIGSALFSNIASALVYIAIGVLFVVCLIKCIAPVVNTRRLLKRATRQINQGERSKRSWQEETFLGKGVLYPHWREYLNNLFFADGEFHNPSNIEDFINEDTVIYGPGRAHFADVAPGLMVSLGFLGTLIGMSSGLSGFDMSNAEKVMGAIRQLVPGMQYAFNTSIVGVVASILITLTNRIVSGAAMGTLTDFYAAMNQRAGVVSVDSMTQIAIYQQEQTALIQKLVSEFTGDLPGRLSSSIADAMNRSVLALKDNMDDFMSFSTREQLRGVDIIVQRFIQQMNLSVDGQFTHLKETLESINHTQLSLSEGVCQSLEGLNRVSQNIAQAAQLSGKLTNGLDKYLSALNATSSQTQDGYDRIAANCEHLEIVSRQQNNYLQSVGKLQGEVSRIAGQFDELIARFTQTLSDNAQASAHALNDAAGSIKQSSDLLASNHKALVGGIAKDIDRTYNVFFKTTNEVVEHLGWAIDDVKNSVACLPETLHGATELYAQQADRLTCALERAQDALDEAVDKLAQARK
ncbi:MAG: hypothetical protein RR150_06775 [Clostridia bacterium]